MSRGLGVFRNPVSNATTPPPGEMAEWPIAPVLKTGVSARGPRVRIPASPLEEPLDFPVSPGSSRGFSFFEQVGFARIVTDSATFSYLADVHVEESHRGKGIGRELVTRLMQPTANDTVRTICLATQDAHEVYRPLGFTETQPGRYMIFRADEQKWQEKSEP